MTNCSAPGNSRRRICAGFSLIELMIAITLGLMIMTGLISVFVKNSLARSEIERSNRQIESGRYAMALLTEDLRMAGYLSSFNPYDSIIRVNAPPLASMTSMPDPCASDVTSLNNSYFFHVQGNDNATAVPSCLSDVRAGSDILVIRRVSTCIAGPAAGTGCDAVVSGAPYFQASNCYRSGELLVPNTGLNNYLAFFTLGTDTAYMNNATTGKHALDCTTVAGYRRYLTHIYFVANNDVAGDGIPTLKRAELLTATGTSADFAIVPLVEGIETVQFEYGVDANDDATVDAYTADPNSYNGCAGGAACLTNWLRTYAVKINLLARNIEKSPGYSDSKTYTLGLKADGTPNIFPPTGTYGDMYKRHVYTAAVRLDNPSGRRLP